MCTHCFIVYYFEVERIYEIYLSRIIASDFVTFLFKSNKFDLCIIVVCFIDNLRAQYHALILYTFMHVNEKYALYALSFNNI